MTFTAQKTIPPAHQPLDPHIQFAMEDPKGDGSTSFLDTLGSPGSNNTLMTSVHRNPTHTDQYLHWGSNHNLSAKYSIYRTLAHRTRVVSTSQPALKQEEDHIRQLLPIGPKQTPHQD